MRKAISQKVSVGEQPRQSDLEELKKDGVTTVVNLRVAGEDTSLTPAEERALAEKLGLQYCPAQSKENPRASLDQFVKELAQFPFGCIKHFFAFFGSRILTPSAAPLSFHFNG